MPGSSNIREGEGRRSGVSGVVSSVLKKEDNLLIKIKDQWLLIHSLFNFFQDQKSFIKQD